MCQIFLAETNGANHTAVHSLRFMRNLAKRHVLASVRRTCGLTQKQLAQLLGVSAISVQRIEQGSLKLSEELAETAQRQLDISAEWLLANDPKIPPLSSRNAYWTKDLYEFRQGSRFTVSEKRLSGRESAFQVNLELTPEQLADKLTDYYKITINAVTDALLEGAKGTPKQGILIHRLTEAMNLLQRDFELNQATMEAYLSKLETTQEAFKQAAKEYAESESKQLWRKAEAKKEDSP
jgi:transcriptional regulator with XRE-family HTH domain